MVWSTKCEKSSVPASSDLTLQVRSTRSSSLVLRCTNATECYHDAASGDDVQSLWIDKLAILLERGDAHDSAVVEDGKIITLLPDTHPAALPLRT